MTDIVPFVTKPDIMFSVNKSGNKKKNFQCIA